MRRAGVDAAMNRRGIGEHPFEPKSTSAWWKYLKRSCCCAPQLRTIYTADVQRVFLRLVDRAQRRGRCGYESQRYW